MSSIVDLYARPGEGATLTLWRTGITNASATVTLNITPAIAGATATAYTDGPGANQGRIDIVIPTNAAAGSYVWTAEISAVEIWAGQVFIATHGYSTSQLATSVDIRTERVPTWVIPRPEDVEGGTLGGGPATQIDETGGPTTLDFAAIADGTFVKRVGTDLVGVANGTGDVTGPASSTDNAFARFDLATGKLLQNGPVICTNLGVLTGIDDMTVTGSITMTALETVDGRDISADWVTSDAHFTSTANPHSVTAAQVGAIATGAKGAASGVASLDANTRLVEAAQVLRVTGQDLSAGACTDGQFLVRSGTTYAGATHDGTGDPHTQYQLEAEKAVASGYASLDSNVFLVEAAQVLRVTGQSLTAGACTDGQFLTRSGTTYAGVTHGNTGDPHTQYQLESEKGAASGYASLDANTRLVEAAQVLRVTGQNLTAGACTDGQFLVRSGTTYAGITHDGTGDPHTQYQLESEKAAASGYASLDASSIVVQAAQALRTTTGPTTLTIGAIVDGEILKRVGTTIVSVAGGSTTTNYVLSANRSVTVTEADVTDWTGVTLVASKLYRYEITVGFSNGTASENNPGIGVFFTNAPTGFSGLMYAMIAATTDADRALVVDTVGTGAAVTATGTIFPIIVTGTFQANATPGTMKIRSSTTGVNTSTLYAGGVLSLTQLN